MKELSLNILDIAENSVKARASRIGISLEEHEDSTMLLTIDDNGCGMDAQMLANVTDPFFTTRTTRPVGMGISLLKLAAEQTGGWLTIESVSEKDCPEKHGTTLKAFFHRDHVDCVPLGDIISTLTTLIHGSPEIDFVYSHTAPKGAVELDTAQLRQVLGEDVPLNSFEVLKWIEEYIKEQYDAIHIL